MLTFVSKGARHRIERALREPMRVTEEVTFLPSSALERHYTVESRKGNKYKVVIAQHPKCSCPDNYNGVSAGFCKHIVIIHHSSL
jgi:hypothetical protein